MSQIKLGSHVGMAGKEMFLASMKEAESYGANILMLYTGAPQNTRRKEISELNIEAGWEYAKKAGIEEIIVHAPYIINLANTVKPKNCVASIYQRKCLLLRNRNSRNKSSYCWGTARHSLSRTTPLMLCTATTLFIIILHRKMY